MSLPMGPVNLNPNDLTNMKTFSILLSFVAGIGAANAAVQVTPVQDKPAELFLSTAKGSTEFPDPGQAPLGPFPFHVKWDFDAATGGHFSDMGICTVLK